ncbi:MAG TPA: SCO1664 family protein [Kineosporiaceae bacterium]
MLDLLSRGQLEVRGRLVDASNATLYSAVTLDGVEAACVYKPVAGERPLWDFPTGTLAHREVAAYVLSAALGWDVVPPTVLRDGPFGPGSVQLWIGTETGADDAPEISDPGAGLVDIVPPDQVPPGWLQVLRAQNYEGTPVSLVHADDPDLRRMAVFDVVANNADRKGGHILRAPGGGVCGVDHGLTFNVDEKLRTVLWGWAGRRLPAEIIEVLRALCRDLADEGLLHEELRRLLTDAEVTRTRMRVARLLESGRHPRPGASRHPIPWPAF